MHHIARALLALVSSGGFLVLLGSGSLRAETVQTRRPSPVYASPGEQSRVVTRVRAGRAVKVLERKKRWLRVRANGRTGWITRTSVAPLARVEASRPKKRRRPLVEGRGRRRGAPGPRDRIGADAGVVAARPEEAGDVSALRERRRAAVRRRLDQRRKLAPGRTASVIDGADEVGEALPPDELPARRDAQAWRGPAAWRPQPARRLPRGAADRADPDGDLDGDEMDEEAAQVEPRPAAVAAAPAVRGGAASTTASAVPEDGDEDDEDAEEGARTGSAGAREFVVVRAAEARLYQLPTSGSDQVLRASAGVRLLVLERSGKWLRVESERGETGWVRASKVDASPVEGARVVAAPTATAPPARREKLVKRAGAGLGYTAIGQRFASGSDDPRATYSLSSGAAVLGAGGELLYVYSDRWLLAGDLGYRYSQATPGVRYTDPETMTAVDIGFKRHQIDIGARAGYALGGELGMVAYGRLGYHYDNFRIDDVRNFDRNLARLPSEVLRGVTVGALLDVPRLGAGWSARVHLDALPLLARRTQTTGLEDGATSHAFAVWGGGRVQYALGDTYRVSGEYEYAYAKTRWSGAKEGSMRPQMADWARRKDSAHLFVIGVGRSF
jgi:SH3-like domain-containing protein